MTSKQECWRHPEPGSCPPPPHRPPQDACSPQLAGKALVFPKTAPNNQIGASSVTYIAAWNIQEQHERGEITKC